MNFRFLPLFQRHISSPSNVTQDKNVFSFCLTRDRGIMYDKIGNIKEDLEEFDDSKHTDHCNCYQFPSKRTEFEVRRTCTIHLEVKYGSKTSVPRKTGTTRKTFFVCMPFHCFGKYSINFEAEVYFPLPSRPCSVRHSFSQTATST